ncbi:MAG: glycerol-3-phosphate acyltransferase [Planctomycetes bacterium]|nr:glycerol-3-phosphate acyltransferase [Planctomycetota bacterium]MCB9870013.1 glycerol-3-phosphate acyltransferase [Planctomycetota bacterium]
MAFVLGLAVAYLIGSIPFALLMVRWVAGVDVRTIGSGNVGATNAARAFGKRGRLPAFLAIYLLDFAKGYLPAQFGPGLCGAEHGLLGPVLFGAAAILGHCTSPFLRFRGGKGVATSTGVFCVLTPAVLGVALLVFLAVFAATRQVFLGSLAIGLTLVIGTVVEDPSGAFGPRLPLTVFSSAVALFLVYTHRSNIRKFLTRRAPA